MAPENLELEAALNDLMNIRTTLKYVSWWALENYSNDQPLPNDDCDAMIGAVEAIAQAVRRVVEAHEAGLRVNGR